MGQGFTADNTTASLQNTAGPAGETQAAGRRRRSGSGRVSAQPEKGRGAGRKDPGAAPRGGHKPRCPGAGRSRTLRHGTGHSPNAAAAVAPAAPSSPQPRLRTRYRPRCYVSGGQRTASGARPLAQAWWQIWGRGWSTESVLGEGVRGRDMERAQCGGPMRGANTSGRWVGGEGRKAQAPWLLVATWEGALLCSRTSWGKACRCCSGRSGAFLLCTAAADPWSLWTHCFSSTVLESVYYLLQTNEMVTLLLSFYR